MVMQIKLIVVVVVGWGLGSLFTDPLFSLESPSSASDKIYTTGDLLTALASLASSLMFSKRTKRKIIKTTSVYRLGLRRWQYKPSLIFQVPLHLAS